MIEYRPWGTYEVLHEEQDLKIKKIYVRPTKRFSLQYHNNREEHWTVVDGVGIITQGDKTSTIRTGELGGKDIMPPDLIFLRLVP